MKAVLFICAWSLLWMLGPAAAETVVLNIGSDDEIEDVLAAQQGKRVTVKLGSGEELTGIVRTVTDDLLHLGGLTGREYFDAVIDIDAVAAVIIRTQQ